METSDPIKELLQTPIPEKLWHYTSINGFQGITTSKRVFATDLRYLNDREEFIHGRKLADDVVQQIPETDENGLPAREFLQKAVNMAFNTGPLHPERLQIFVASFSAAEDQLSQWRGYSRGSSGVSLGFNLSGFRPPADIDTLVAFAPCVYDLASKKKLIQHALHHFRDAISDRWNKMVDAAQRHIKAKAISGEKTSVQEFGATVKDTPEFTKILREAMANTNADLLRTTALLKNSAFHEEMEWRLVLPVWLKKEPLKNPRRFRVEATTLVPYISHPFSSDPEAPLPIKDVILGPGSDENSIPAAQSFLESLGIKLIPRMSEVPYRSR
jgi:hypothetical protein